MPERHRSVLNRLVAATVGSDDADVLAPRVIRRLCELDGIESAGVSHDFTGHLHVCSQGREADEFLWLAEAKPRHTNVREVIAECERQGMPIHRDGKWSRLPAVEDRCVAIEVYATRREPTAIFVLFAEPAGFDAALDMAVLMTSLCASWCAVHAGQAASDSLWGSARFLSLAALSGDIVHAINGSLAVIGMTTEMAISTPGFVLSDETLRGIQVATDRVGHSVKSLESVISEWGTDPDSCDAVTAVWSAVDSLRRDALAAHIEIDFENRIGSARTAVSLGGPTLAWCVREVILEVFTRLNSARNATSETSLVLLSVGRTTEGSVCVTTTTPGVDLVAAPVDAGRASRRQERWETSADVMAALGCDVRWGGEESMDHVTMVLPR